MMKIKFLVPNNSIIEPNLGVAVYVNPSYWMMKAYYTMYGKHNEILEWCDPDLGLIERMDVMIDNIIEKKIDILCLGMFLWNKTILLDLSKRVKQELPNIKIIAGGPDLDANTNPEFFKINPQIDYVVYGDGERAFTLLLDSIIEGVELLNAVNIVTPTKMFPHEVFSDEAFSKVSPWLMFRDEVEQIVEKIGKDRCWICWEMSRGCPYKCSFCDWSSGLHHKVKRRKSNWKEEIDFFATLDVAALYVNDANWGIFPEDLEIHRYAVARFNRFRAINLPKLNKKNAFEILSISYEYSNKVLFKISLQDLDEQVLRNIDRPEIPWDQHKELIIDWLAKHPNARVAAELIIGLPGQTIDSWIKNIIEIESAGMEIAPPGFWMMLPLSPGSDPAYQQKHGLIVKDLIYLVENFEDENSVYDTIHNGRVGWYKAPTVIGSNTVDLCDMLIMRSLALGLGYSKKIINKNLRYSKIINKLREKLEPICKLQADWIKQTGIFAIKKDHRLVNQNDMFTEQDLLSLIKSIKQT